MQRPPCIKQYVLG